MATLTTTKATVEQTVALAKFLVGKELHSSQCVDWLKSQSYKVRGTTFNATNVAFCMAGYELAKSEVPKPKAKRVAKVKD
jgi:hypothetical protein